MGVFGLELSTGERALLLSGSSDLLLGDFRERTFATVGQVGARECNALKLRSQRTFGRAVRY